MVSMIFVYDAAQKFESSNPTAHVVPPGTALNEMCHLLIKRQSKWRCVHINLKYSELFEKFTILSLNAATWMRRSIMKHTKRHAKKYRSFTPFYYLLQGRGCFIVRWSFFIYCSCIISVCYSQRATHSITILLQYVLLVDYFSAFKNIRDSCHFACIPQAQWVYEKVNK